MREYTGPTAATVASRLPGGPGRPDSAGRYRARGFCHGHGDKRDSASLSIQDHQDGGLNVTCFAGCDRQTIIVALEQATGLTIWQAWASTGAAQGRFSRPDGTHKVRTTFRRDAPTLFQPRLEFVFSASCAPSLEGR